MKKIFIYIFLLLVLGIANVYSQTTTQNYIRTRIYTNETGTTYLDTIKYFDGLGRLVQIVQQGATPTNKDLVALQEYDALGRKSNAWLPASISGNNGKYVASATLKTQAIASNGNDQNPYSYPVYETSPLSRVVKLFGPGASWHNNKAVESAYKTNIAGNATLNCKLYKVGGTNQAPTLSQNGNYSSGELSVTEIKDENQNISYEFKDKRGQVVLTRQMQGTVAYDTYYVYNGFGLQCFVLPPRIQDEGITETKLDELAYRYRYDELNRPIAKKIPGCEWIYYVYDKADRLIFTQDGEQRKRKEWTFTIPDVFERIVLTGTCIDSLKNYAANPLGNNVVKAARANADDTYKGYATPTGVTLSSPKILSVNYYDDYAFFGYNGVPNTANAQYTAEAGYGVCYGDHQSTNKAKNKGLLTGTLTAQMNADGTLSSTYLYSVMYYDNKGQLIQVKSSNHLAGGVEKEYFAYNFTGQIIKRKHVHAATGQNTQTEVYTYGYDHAGRLLTTNYKLNTTAELTLASNTYDELGRLKTNQKRSHDNLKTTYGYNVRSWTKSITNSLFSQTLYYNDTYGGSTAQYNGNIGAMSWKLSTETKTRGYKFTYDNLSRLTSASYLENGSVNSNFNTSYTYDKHGNMTSLTRRGNTGTSTYGIIDNLTMTYSGNQLIKVEDTGASVSMSASMDFKNGSTSAKEYEYDANGNMNKDLNKGISAIS
ncbi:DUF6443 domain-containing protein, partial [Bacteroides sp. UBA939]|uniref:DUF6443 domain-containing protein n=1 Tax=Bacteroides sp. UBA939 TaxID=1946092 RepID=UPI0025BACB1A